MSRLHRALVLVVSTTALFFAATDPVPGDEAVDTAVLAGLLHAADLDTIESILLGFPRMYAPHTVASTLLKPGSTGLARGTRELLLYRYLEPWFTGAATVDELPSLTRFLRMLPASWEHIDSGLLRARLLHLAALEHLRTGRAEPNADSVPEILPELMMRSAVDLHRAARTRDGREPGTQDYARLTPDQIHEFVALCEVTTVWSSLPLGEILMEVGIRSRSPLVVSSARRAAEQIIRNSP